MSLERAATLAGNLGLPFDALPHESREPSLSALVELPHIEAIRADLDAAVQRASGRETAHVMWLRRSLEVAALRDGLVADRRATGDPYAECWCLGTGGKGTVVQGIRTSETTMTPTVRMADGELVGPEYAFVDYCPCPDGERAREEHRAAGARMQEAYDDYMKRTRAEIARIPSLYDGLTMQTWAKAARELGASENDITTAYGRVGAWVTDIVGRADGTPPTLLLAGTYGTGKSGIAACVGRRFLDLGHSVLYRKVAEILAEIRAAPWRSEQRGETAPPPTEQDIIRRAQSCGLLILDDFGAEALVGQGADRAIEALLVMLDGRLNEGLPTILTTNLGHEDLAERVGGRLMDRIVPSRVGVVVALKTPSLRRSTW